MTASPQTRQQRRRRWNTSLLRSSLAFRETPDYVAECVSEGKFVICQQCRRVVGVGMDLESAIRNSVANKLGVRKGDQIFCTEHAGVES